MLSDKQLMQMALDALQWCYDVNEWPANGETPQDKAIEALRARLAQPEQEIEPDRDHVEDDGCPTEKAVLQRFWREHQAQPERKLCLWKNFVDGRPEPVAWMHNFIDEVVIAHRPADLDRHPDRWTALYKDPTPCQTCEALARTVMMDQVSYDIPPRHREPPTQDLSAPLTVNGVPMYPQREWQGLTDEEIKDHWITCMWKIEGTALPIPEFARAIEAKLKEKNNG